MDCETPTTPDTDGYTRSTCALPSVARVRVRLRPDVCELPLRLMLACWLGLHAQDCLLLCLTPTPLVMLLCRSMVGKIVGRVRDMFTVQSAPVKMGTVEHSVVSKTATVIHWLNANLLHASLQTAFHVENRPKHSTLPKRPRQVSVTPFELVPGWPGG